MRILLDENFPLQLYRRLGEAGYQAEHIIALGLRGLSDDAIRQRLAAEADLLFLTQDTEFADLAPDIVATVMISRVPQAIPITRRVELWEHAIDDFLQHPIPGRLFEVLGDGRVVAWDFRP
ncbi:MAG: DUF5615 family PIN-like protein [Acidimicrobiales bacterium]